MTEEELIQLETMAEMTIDSNEKVDMLNRLAWQLRYKNRKKAKENAEEAYKLSAELQYVGGLNYAKLYLALLAFWANEEGTHLLQVHEAMQHFESAKDYLGLVRAKNIGATMYDQYGQYEKALGLALDSVKISQKNSYASELSECLTTLGQVYSRIQDYENAISSIKEGMELRAELDDAPALASSLNLLARNYSLNKQYNKAQEYYLKSLELREEINDEYGIPWTYLGLASMHQQQGKLDEAIEYYEKGIELNKSDDKRYQLLCLLEEGKIWQQKNEQTKAIHLLEHALKLANELKISSLQADACKYLAKCYEEKEETELALKFFKEHYRLKEEVLNVETTNKLKQQEVAFSVEKAEQEAEIYRLKNIELKKANEEIAYQKEVLEEKNKEITDSIEYARHIQQAFLQNQSKLNEYFKEAFLLFRPKDIVSGDFYWLEKVKDNVIFAVADCTGHGVPGAMVSVICNNALNRSVLEFGLRKPGEILDKTRELVIETFEKSQVQVKDGMDIALCSLNVETRQLQFAGANNPLWIVSEKKVNGAEEHSIESSPISIYEIKGDRQPVGNSEIAESFTTHELTLAKGDAIYIFSDGFADQFGGEKGKKFKYKPFKELLLGFQNNAMQKQGEELGTVFTSWKEGYEQIDDMCVLGVKVG